MSAFHEIFPLVAYPPAFVDNNGLVVIVGLFGDHVHALASCYHDFPRASSRYGKTLLGGGACVPLVGGTRAPLNGRGSRLSRFACVGRYRFILGHFGSALTPYHPLHRVLHFCIGGREVGAVFCLAVRRRVFSQSIQNHPWI